MLVHYYLYIHVPSQWRAGTIYGVGCEYVRLLFAIKLKNKAGTLKSSTRHTFPLINNIIY